MTEQVLEFVGRLERSNSVGGREDNGDVVVAPTDANIFHDIARMEDVSSSRRDLNLNHLSCALFVNLLNIDSHLGGTRLHLVSVQLKAKDSVDVVNLNIKVIVSQRGGDFGLHLGVVLISDLDLLTFVLPLSSTVGGELGGHDGQADLGFLKVHCGNFNENILGLAGDLGSVRVDQRRER